jgi:hypothetical protein
MKYTVRNNGSSNEKVLNINGLQSVCPFPQPFPMPSQDGKSMVVMRVPCTTQCPHAEITDDGRWVITCGGVVKGLIIEEIEEEEVQVPEPELDEPDGAKIVTF